MSLSFAQKKVIWRLAEDYSRGMPLREITSEDMKKIVEASEKEMTSVDAHALIGGLLKIAYEFESLNQIELTFYGNQVKNIANKYLTPNT